MAVQPFGTTSNRFTEYRDRYQAEVRRQAAKYDFEVFLKEQRERVTATLKQQTQRIHRARFGDGQGDETHFVVMRRT